MATPLPNQYKRVTGEAQDESIHYSTIAVIVNNYTIAAT